MGRVGNAKVGRRMSERKTGGKEGAGGDSKDPMRWKWIHGRGKSVSSVDEELGLGMLGR